MANRSSVLSLALGGAALALNVAGAQAVAPGAHSSALAATPPPTLPGIGRVLTTATPAPSLTIRYVSPGGTEVHAFAESSEPTTFGYTIEPVSTTTTPTGPGRSSALGDVANLSGGEQVSTGGPAPQPVYDTKHNLYKSGLTPDTTYDLDVSGMTQGVPASPRRRASPRSSSAFALPSTRSW
jgi:hypothetical protein